eukprot:8510008-Pyramimonas_sp.AAC.1
MRRSRMRTQPLGPSVELPYGATKSVRGWPRKLERVAAIVRVGNRAVVVQFPGSRHTLCIEVPMVRELASDSTALRT